MPEPPPAGLILRPLGGHRRFFSGTLCLLLVAASGLLGWRDRRIRSESRVLLGEVGVAAGPAGEAIRTLATGDLALSFAVSTAISQLAPGGDAAGAAARLGRDTRPLLGDTARLAAVFVSARPASAYGRLLLGQAGEALWDLEAGPNAPSTEAWRQAFEGARSAAPDFDLIPLTEAATYLSAWPRLPAGDRDEASKAIGEALRSREGARRLFPEAWRKLGPAALRLLPNDPDELAESASWLRAVGQSGAAKELEARRSR